MFSFCVCMYANDTIMMFLMYINTNYIKLMHDYTLT